MVYYHYQMKIQVDQEKERKSVGAFSMKTLNTVISSRMKIT